MVRILAPDGFSRHHGDPPVGQGANDGFPALGPAQINVLTSGLQADAGAAGIAVVGLPPGGVEQFAAADTGCEHAGHEQAEMIRRQADEEPDSYDVNVGRRRKLSNPPKDLCIKMIAVHAICTPLRSKAVIRHATGSWLRSRFQGYLDMPDRAERSAACVSFAAPAANIQRNTPAEAYAGLLTPRLQERQGWRATGRYVDLFTGCGEARRSMCS